MPSRGTAASEAEFDSVRDEIAEIIQKYEHSHAVILCGDSNASLSGRDSTRDKKF
jgi:hypothetical protein